jgi:hypothetical protein
MTTEAKKTCFVISPIDEPGTDTRERSDQILKYIIEPAVGPLGYRAIRADEMNKPGIITSQIINSIYESELVIADLTERNPNVFYELAVRHVVRKPFIQIIQKGEVIPFDVAATRIISVDHRDLASASEAQTQIREQIETLERNPEETENPISVSQDLQRLRQSEDPEQRSQAEILSTLSELRNGMAKLTDLSAVIEQIRVGAHFPSSPARTRGASVEARRIRHIANESNSVFAFLIFLEILRAQVPWLYEVGLEAHRKAAEGQSAKALEIFQELVRLVEISGQYVPGIDMHTDVTHLFNQMMRCYENGWMENELPW